MLLLKKKKLFLKKLANKELYKQLEILKTPHLFETVRFVRRIIDGIQEDKYNISPKFYYTPLKQLLSERYLAHITIQKFFKKKVISSINSPLAKRLLRADQKVVKNLTFHLNALTSFFKSKKEKGEFEKILTSEEKKVVEGHVDRIMKECWRFHRALNLYESNKILLRAISEYNEFEDDFEKFKKEYKIDDTIEVHI